MKREYVIVLTFWLAIHLVAPLNALGSTESNPSAIAQRKMNRALDLRLNHLKKRDRKQYATEMGLQKAFNESVKGFCSHYRDVCNGSVCSMCVSGCFSASYAYRKSLADQINVSKLSFKPRGAPPALTEKHFGSFASGLCQMPDSVWKKAGKPAQCQEAVLADIYHQVVLPLTVSEVEGDVCAQLPR